MPNFTIQNGLNVLTATPTGDAGTAINQNFITIGTSLAALQTTVAGLPTSYLSAAGGTVTGELGALGGSFIVEQTGGVNSIQLSSTNSGKTAVTFMDHNQNPIVSVGANSISNLWYVEDASNNPLLTVDYSTKIISTSAGTLLDDGNGNVNVFGGLTTANNTLDDNGNVTITGTLTLPISSTAPLHSLTTASAGSSTAVHVDTLFAGTSGSTSYTITDLVTLLKSAGILKA